MAKWTQRDSNSDPFNAGEPTLPWDDPSQLHDECALDDTPGYDAPSKEPDDYDAPSPSDDVGGTARRRAERARQAAKSFKAQGGAGWTHGKLSFNWIVGIVVLSMLLGGVGSLFGAVADFAGGIVSGVTQGVFSDDGLTYWEDDLSPEPTFYINKEAGEEAITTLTEGRLDSLASDGELLADIAEGFSEDCRTSLGRTADELGIDASALALWLVQGLEYEVDEAYCFNGYDGAAPEGSVFLDTLSYDFSSLVWEFVSEAKTYLLEEGLVDWDSVPTAELAGEHRDMLRGMLAEELAAAERSRELYVGFDFSCDADEIWSFNEEAYRVGLFQALGVLY